MTGAGGLVVALVLLVLLLADVASSGSRREAFITLVSSENYLLGARVLVCDPAIVWVLLATNHLT